jgi:DNA-binding PadR family transcriptional regulator
MSSLSNLEGAALAVIARLGAATAYAVARDFADSPSEYWSGSAGAVYPMIKRLVADGLLAVDPAFAPSGRGGVHYGITDPGRTAMEAWLLDVERAAGMGFDPLRTRLLNLDLVDPAVGRDFLKQVQARVALRARAEQGGLQPKMAAISSFWWKQRLAWLRHLLK